MTDIATLGNLLRLARDTVTNPREGATTVLSFAPARQALWLMFALVVVTSMMMGEIVALLGRIVYGQRLDAPAVVGIALVLAGVVVLQGFSDTVVEAESPHAAAAPAEDAE